LGVTKLSNVGDPIHASIDECIALGRVAEGDRQFPAFQGHNDRGPVHPRVADREEDILPHQQLHGLLLFAAGGRQRYPWRVPNASGQPELKAEGSVPHTAAMKSSAKLNLTAVYEPAPEGGFTCSFEEFPVVFSEGETVEEAEANLLDALRLVLDCHRDEARKRKPAPGSVRHRFELAPA